MAEMPRTTRKDLDFLVRQMVDERSSFVSHWRDLADHIMPRRSRFQVEDVNRGDKRNTKIIDSTCTFSARTLASGMVGGLTSPARPWFRLTVPDPDLADYGAVKYWLHVVTQRMQTVFARSNFYTSGPLCYLDLAVFGTAAVGIFEDDEDVIRCHPYPVGSYMLASNDRGTVDCFARQYKMTVRQLVERFGIDNCSPAVKVNYNRGATEVWIEVCHVIKPNPDADRQKMGPEFKPWLSAYYEVGSNEQLVLGFSGFDEFPIMAPRWVVTGEDVYGTSPCMDVLGDVRALQLAHRKKGKAIDKMIDPPMVGPTALKNARASLIPGDITYVDINQPHGGFRPAHEVTINLNDLRLDIQEYQQRIRRANFEDLFLMLSSLDSREMTAEEIVARKEEKLVMLSPVLERLNDEWLDPVIDRVFAIMERRGMIPPPPEELAGQELRVEYISILAQAQKMVSASSVQRLVAFVGNLAGADPTVLDKLDADQAIDEFGDMVGSPPHLLRTDEQVAAIRQSRAQAQQAAQQAALLQQSAQGAKLLSETKVDEDNALTRIAAAAQGAVA